MTHLVATHLALNPLSGTDLIKSFGLFGVLAIVFAETGLLVGFFLPGDTLLVFAGIAASSAAERIVGAKLPIAALVVGVPIAAIAGSQLGHYLGAKYGRKLFDKPESRFFHPKHVDKAEMYFDRYGGEKAVFIARFIPVVRTFLNPVAGMLEMPARKFFLWNVVSGVIWTETVLLLGYFVGDKVKGIDKYLIPGAIVIAVVSFLPVAREILKARKEGRDGAAAMDQAQVEAAGARHKR